MRRDSKYKFMMLKFSLIFNFELFLLLMLLLLLFLQNISFHLNFPILSFLVILRLLLVAFCGALIFMLRNFITFLKGRQTFVLCNLRPF